VFTPAGVYAYAEHRLYTPADDTGLAAYRVKLEGIGVEAATGRIRTARRCRTKAIWSTGSPRWRAPRRA
jgi:hypothetical protein